ncbi:MAG: rhomboid family intramembrane serine protease [Hyphomicrobiaceae bacterium]
MFVPLSDDNPLRSIHLQWVTITLIALNVIIYGLEVTPQGQAIAASFAIVPSELIAVRFFGGAAGGAYDTVAVPEWLTVLSYMFLHGDLLHLGANMLFLWVFGDNVEDALGHVRFLGFYLLCGIAGGLAHTLMAPVSKLPLIGASGAVAGVIAAYLLLHPHVRVWVLAFRVIPLRITASLALGAWILTQVVMVVLQSCGDQFKFGQCVWRVVGNRLPAESIGDGVAWWAHIGGIVAGAVLICVMRPPGVELLQRPPPTPQS